MKLTAEQAREFLCGGGDPDLGLEVESNEHTGEGRWTSYHFLVLKDKAGRFWATTYEQGLTEYQDTRPFEDESEVTFEEVEKVPVTTYEYRKIGEGGVREPRGDSPDSPPAGEHGVPGEGPGVSSADASADYATPPGGYVGIGLSPLLVSLDCVHFYEVPDGTSISEFLATLEEIKT